MSDRLAEIEARLAEPFGVLDQTTRADVRDLLAVVREVQRSHIATHCADTCYAELSPGGVCTCGGVALRAALANLEGGA